MPEKPPLSQNPLVHILALGLLLGATLLLLNGPPRTGAEAKQVVVTGTDLAHLSAGFMRTWSRPPTEAELKGELESFLRAEILYREALARGYDEDDLVVRRAMQRKMEFLGETQSTSEPPTDDEVRAYFALRQEKYRVPAVMSFTQILFSRDTRDTPERDAREALEVLRRSGPAEVDIDSWGDRSMLPRGYDGAPERDVSRTFGEAFTESIASLPVSEWSGPVESGYGLHVVFVSQREDARAPDWREVRDQVALDMDYEARSAAKEQMFQEIAQQYRIILDDEVRALMERGR